MTTQTGISFGIALLPIAILFMISAIAEKGVAPLCSVPVCCDASKKVLVSYEHVVFSLPMNVGLNQWVMHV